LGDAKHLGQIADRDFVACQRVKDPDARHIPKDLEGFGQRCGRVVGEKPFPHLNM
jgi:hypothetical protein